MSTTSDPNPAGPAGPGGLVLRGQSVAEIARQVAAAGQDLNDRLRPLLDRIRELEQFRPWGGDDTGEDFRRKVYHAPVDGKPFNQLLLTALEDAGKELIEEFSPGSRQAAGLVTEADATAARRIARAG